MEQFENQNRLNQFLSFMLIVTGTIGFITIGFLLWRGMILDGNLIILMMLVVLSLTGIVTGVSLWLKYYWSFTASFIYFSIQILSYESEGFSFSFYSGIKFLIITSLNNAKMAVNIFALLMLVIAFIARNITRKNMLDVDAEL